MTGLVEIKDGKIVASENAIQTIINFEKQKAEMELFEQSFKNALKDKMEELGIEKFSIEGLTATIRKATTRQSLDSKRLKEELPDVYDEYLKTSDVASSITIKISDDE